MSCTVPNKDIILTIIENESSKNNSKIISNKHNESRIRSIWVKASKMLTFAIPEKLIPGNSKQAKIAWREKVLLCGIIFVMSMTLLTYLIFLPSTLCPANNLMSLKEIRELPHYNPHIIIHGKIYDFTNFAQKHSNNGSIPHHIYDYAGKDASALFPKPILSKVINGHRQRNILENFKDETNFEPFFHSWQDLNVASNWPISYDLCYSWDQISDAATSEKAWIVIDNDVFDISELNSDTKNLKDIEKDISEIFSDSNFKALISAPWGRDKSVLFRYHNSHEHFEALLKGYKIGVVDYRESFQCKSSNFIMIFSTGIVVLIVLVKFLSSLQLGIKKEPEKLNRHVLILIPCYSEDEESLKRSIHSVVNLEYDNRKKIMVIIADGNVTGRGNKISTPELLKTILGIKKSAQSNMYQSVSSEGSEMNKAEIYFGHYKTESFPLPYIFIAKVGCSHDPNDSGNRGKRDSQLILLKFFSRINYKYPLNPLELEIYRGFYEILEINPLQIEFILMVDADTELFCDALNRLLACCIHDSKVIGICGETRIRNEKTSWVTMIQIYEYFISHHMSKSFESLFGCVTCLPGCFCMYRLKNISDNQPLLIHRDLIDEYSQTNVHTLHQKNLLSLGEDRYLTTLALKHFPNYRTKFTPDAVCRTVVPETWPVLLSQRRRWINSTIHNLFELLLLPNLCGFCLFSMRFVIFMDLFSTLILPSTVIYMIFLIAKSVQNHISAKVSVIMICSVYGLQTVVFMLKKQWQHVGWMLIYISALPIFGFFIPIYSFWHFDDFSWGRTRRLKDPNGESFIENELQKEPEPLVLKTWEEYLSEINSCIPLISLESDQNNKKK
jgi:chitin synthase